MNYLELITLNNLTNFIGACFVIYGCFMVFTSAIGMLRMPDFFTKCHAAGVADSFGCPIIILGLAFYANLTDIQIKLVLLFFFIFITSPISTYCISQSAINSGLNPLGKKIEEQNEEEYNSD